mgnify:CR=1 FL=1|jgi:hypothetical protein
MGGWVARLRTRALSLILQASNLARPHVAAKGDDLFSVVLRYLRDKEGDTLVTIYIGHLRCGAPNLDANKE